MLDIAVKGLLATVPPAFRRARSLHSLGSRGGHLYASRCSRKLRGTIRRVATAKNNPNLNYSPDRLVSAAPVEDDSSFELKLRPQRLNEFIGQAKVKENLSVAIEAARSRGGAIDHVP